MQSTNGAYTEELVTASKNRKHYHHQKSKDKKPFTSNYYSNVSRKLKKTSTNLSKSRDPGRTMKYKVVITK